MQIVMNVHNVTFQPMTVQVEHDGETTPAVIQCMEVELVGPGYHGSTTFRFTKAADVEEARKNFVKGGTVTLSI
jgi:hypothetical protein